jgi:hypothetical protein
MLRHGPVKDVGRGSHLSPRPQGVIPHTEQLKTCAFTVCKNSQACFREPAHEIQHSTS